MNIDFSKQCLVVTQGFPASGKSTWALKMVEGNKKVLRVNRDAIRLAFGFKWDRRHEKVVVPTRDFMINEALSRGYSVINDDTNITSIDWAERIARGFNIPLIVNDDFLKVTVEECIKRDAAREASVGKDVIEEFYYRYWDNQDKPVNFGDRQAIMCDLDGTLCHLPEGMSYPAAYDRDYSLDRVDPNVAEAILIAKRAGKDVILLSGRFSERKDQTLKFLETYHIPYDALLMRPVGDRRPDTIVKKELYLQHVQGKWHVHYVLDDRPSVVRMWRAECGLPCFQVAANMEF